MYVACVLEDGLQLVQVVGCSSEQFCCWSL